MKRNVLYKLLGGTVSIALSIAGVVGITSTTKPNDTGTEEATVVAEAQAEEDSDSADEDTESERF